MKNKIISCVGMVLLAPAFATAVPITGQGLPTDNANLSGGTVIDFESVGVLNTPSLSLSGVTFTGDSNIEVDSDYAGNYNTRGTYHMTNHGSGPDFFRFDFSSPVNAFAFLWGAADYDWILSAYSGATLLESFVVNPTFGSNSGDYFGITSAGMTHATLAHSGNFSDYVFIDNFTFSASRASVPEPATFALVSLGLAGLGFSRKQKKS